MRFNTRKLVKGMKNYKKLGSREREREKSTNSTDKLKLTLLSFPISCGDDAIRDKFSALRKFSVRSKVRR